MQDRYIRLQVNLSLIWLGKICLGLGLNYVRSSQDR